MNQRNVERISVGDLIIDTGLLRVIRNGVDIALPRLSFDLLLALVRDAPNVLSNEELSQRVWPGLVVTPETVSQRVKLVRDALDDDPRAPRYIAVLRGRGYSIIPPVTFIASADAPAPGPPRTRMYWLYGALAVALLLVLAQIFWPRATRTAATPARAETAAPVPAGERTVAVLPFQNLSIDPADRFLAPGISEMVNDRLASTGQLVVIARSSSDAAAERRYDAKATGELLGARYLVDGGVQRIGQQLRVTARLVNCESGAQLWSARFDRKLDDLFHIQDEIADSVAKALEAKVVYVSAQVGSVANSNNIDAYLAYLEGRVLLRRWTSVGAEAAAGHFEQAMKLDPKFAAAIVAFAEAKMMSAGRRRDIDDQQLAALARNYAPLIAHALVLDPTLGAAYIWRAEWLDEEDPKQQEADYRHGLALDPNDGHGLTMYADWLRHGEASDSDIRAAVERAVLVDPLSPRAHYVRAMELGQTPPEREKLLIEALKVDPNFYPTLTGVGRFRAMLHGEFAESIKLLERAIASDPEQVWARIDAMLVYLDAGDPDAARDVCAPSALATRNAEFSLLLYAGNSREADRVAAGINFQQDRPDQFGENEAMRDAAMASGDFRRLIKAFRIEHMLAHPDESDINGWDFRTYPTFAHGYRLAGYPQLAERALAEVTQWMDANEADLGTIYTQRTHAAVFALKGNREAALQALAAGFRSGDRTRWWYTVSQDPIYEPLRAAPAFQAIALEARQHAAQQHALLEDMRKRGEVPMRPAKH